MDSLYTDLVEVSAHVGARNRGFEPANHEMWQGKVYRWTEKPRLSSGDYPDFIRHTGYGSGEGLGGWNCRHSFHAFVEGVSERTYTDDELNAMKGKNRTFQYEGREYDGYTATQKQREIERTLRRLKRERSSYKAAGLTDEYNAVNAKIRRLTYKYRQFSKKAGLPEQRERTKVQYTDNASDKQAALSTVKRTSGQSVLAEYQERARPGSGAISYEDGYKIAGHSAEIKIAQHLQQKFGGDITLLKESCVRGVKRPDYLWNGELWELKSASSINAVDQEFRKALKQIGQSSGGVIIDLNTSEIELYKVVTALERRFIRSKIDRVDVLIKQQDDYVLVLRYKK